MNDYLIHRNGFKYYMTNPGFFADGDEPGRKPWRRRWQANGRSGFYGLIQYQKEPFGSYLYQLIKNDYTASTQYEWAYLAERKSHHEGWVV